MGRAGEWIPLATAPAGGAVSHVDGMTADEVFVFTRLAGDKTGATKMDRPEDIQPSPVTGKGYVALTNNSHRGKTGYAPADEATAFAWSLFLVAADPADPATYFAGFPKDKVSPISCPDNVAFDAHGNL